MERESKIYVAGHSGMAGSAIVRKLVSEGYKNIVTREHSALDLTRQTEVESFFKEESPDCVFLAAAAVGGIRKNMLYPADMLQINLAIQTNVIRTSFETNVSKLVFLGSSCIYPRLCPQPMKEEYFLTGPFEPTNEGYAIAKAAGIRLCEYYNRQYGTEYLSIMPCNLYGLRDHYGENAHVVASLIRRFHEAKAQGTDKVVVWGSGNQRREFMFADDMADAALYFMDRGTDGGFVNVGTGTDVSIRELAGLIARIVGFEGEIVMDPSKPDGMPQKLMDVSRAAALGWRAKTGLEEGIRITYRDFLEHPEYATR